MLLLDHPSVSASAASRSLLKERNRPLSSRRKNGACGERGGQDGSCVSGFSQVVIHEAVRQMKWLGTYKDGVCAHPSAGEKRFLDAGAAPSKRV